MTWVAHSLLTPAEMEEPSPAQSPLASSPSRSSIRGGSPTPHAGSPVPQYERDEEDTFTSMLSISVDAPIGSMSISECSSTISELACKLTMRRK